jgi:hypothetical protein
MTGVCMTLVGYFLFFATLEDHTAYLTKGINEHIHVYHTPSNRLCMCAALQSRFQVSWYRMVCKILIDQYN